MPEFTGQRDLRTYLRVLWRWKFLFLLFVIAAPGVAYLLEHNKPKTYSSTALVGVNQATVNTSLISGGGSFSTSNVTAIAELVTTSPVAQAASELLASHPDPGSIVSEVSASGDPITNFVRISAVDRSPERAAAIANAFARAIALNRRNAAVSEINSAIRGVEAQLSRLGKHDTTTRPQLESQLNQLRAARSTQGTEAALLQPATPSATPVGPHLRRAIELALVIGLLLGFGAVVLAENADRRLRSPEDLEGMTELPTLAAIAPSAFSSKLETRPEDDEAFNMLRTALTYFNLDRGLKSVIITSAGEKEGKTTIATRLALNVARAGQRVLLVDADLRRGRVAPKLGIEATRGLGAVLAGEEHVANALVEFPLEDAPGGRLTILPAGDPPQNPAALLSSDAVLHVLKGLEARSDLVIIDTPAALAVSDPLPLMGLVSGVVLVARMNKSSRVTIRRLQRIITAAHGTLVGVVATGAPAGAGYDHYSSKVYTKNGSNGRRLGRRSKAKKPAVIVASDQAADDARSDDSA